MDNQSYPVQKNKSQFGSHYIKERKHIFLNSVHLQHLVADKRASSCLGRGILYLNYLKCNEIAKMGDKIIKTCTFSAGSFYFKVWELKKKKKILFLFPVKLQIFGEIGEKGCQKYYQLNEKYCIFFFLKYKL